MISLKHSPVYSNSEIMGGTLVFRNTRVPVQALLDYLDDGYTLEEFLDNFTSLVDEFLEFVLLKYLYFLELDCWILCSF